MRIALIFSKKDIASMSMLDELLKTGEFEETRLEGKPPLDGGPIYLFKKNQSHRLYTLSCESIHAEDIDKIISADLFVFVTRHQGAAGVPSLSAHAIGNFGAAEYGGKDGVLVPTRADMIHHALELMKTHSAPLGWDVVQEATHHGPYLETPTLFIEIGSTKTEWENKDAAAVQVKVILDLLTTEPPKKDLAIGFGGQHTTPAFKKVMARSDLAFGHIAAKYAMDSVTEGLIEEMLEKTLGPAAGPSAQRPLIVFDWKGMGLKKHEILAIVEKLGYAFKYTDDFGKEESEPVRNS